jgi:hypothetical protein
VKTNSGEGSTEIWDRKMDFQGAGAAERWWVVVDILRRKRTSRNWEDVGAMLEEEDGG